MKKNLNRKMLRSAVIAITVLIIGMSAIYAYNNNRENYNNMMTDMNMMNMNDMNGDMMQTCMALMENSKGMSEDEKEEMINEMDKDNDGKCDMCGMSIEMCKQMINN